MSVPYRESIIVVFFTCCHKWGVLNVQSLGQSVKYNINTHFVWLKSVTIK